ncbi:hypothetical protein N7510_004867 [Penicillium lagena]|uniref:uncharacterized protein n=1 Tax=Penicillium lagena TaxID=94218 RepID=UPI002540119E|nr:uncharacterized protein N7510_004867 [Penicillium lagena]KAJ5620883.1 hypothetical protein N7510_004867 [Penicillium lagena]
MPAPSPPVEVPVDAPTMGPGEPGGSARSSPRIRPLDGQPASQTTPVAPMPASSYSQVSFEDFAARYRQSQRKQVQRKRLEKRLRATKVSIGVSARMIRIGASVQRGLVEALRNDDKTTFVALYHTFHDLHQSCGTSDRRDDQDSMDQLGPSSASELHHFPDFFHQLSPQSRTDLLEILRLVRSDSQFLVNRLRSLTSSQLAALSSQAAALDSSDPSYPSSSRGRAQSYLSRAHAPSTSFKDHALAFERADPLPIMLCNVFAAPVDLDTPESRLRVEVWSSVCAQLLAQGSSRYYPLIGQILSAWAAGSNWKARPKFELYLMDILQTGAFLLEHIDPPSGLDFAAEPLDPLRTDVAEEFFASAVEGLFRVLDDPDAGFPHAILQFAKAVLRKLDTPEGRHRFLEFLFVQWFFSKFLYGALTYPESHGLLLDFHIAKDAREKLLGQVGLRAYSQVFAVLRSMHHFSIPRPAIRDRVENMLAQFQTVGSPEHSTMDASMGSSQAPMKNSPSTFLMLSAADIHTLLVALFPKSCSHPYSPTAAPGVPAWTSIFSQPHRHDQETPVEPGLLRSKYDPSSQSPSYSDSLFSTEARTASLPEDGLGQRAARIRFELADLGDPDERLLLQHPSGEDWTIFSIACDGYGLTWSLLPDCKSEPTKSSVIESDDDARSTTLGLEENHEALQKAIVRLVKENRSHDPDDDPSSPTLQLVYGSLRQLFNQAMASCHHDSDFVGAHYWWNAARQIRQSASNPSSTSVDDSWILGPMHDSCTRSLNHSQVVIERCEIDFVSLDQSLLRLQTQLKGLMATVSRVRNKMWYMTDVKNSMRYEDAKHVAMALKTMIYSARLFNHFPDDSRSRTARSLGGSLFQKPELQIMNMMKAPSSQGGPNKLSDEQVDLTRKWLSHNSIENFCKGEERIHRFCYEVRNSINRLVGETMTEAPVLWASELFQAERAKYEGYGARAFPGLSMPDTPRPSTTASEDAMHASQLHGTNLSVPDPMSRISQDNPSLGRNSSIQSLLSDKLRLPRDLPSIDVGSIGGSLGRAASTSTGDTCSTFWSTPHRHPMYAASASSIYSRPPSMFSEAATRLPRRTERKTHGKAVFMDDVRQTLTSLLLSDLGSPVWSCGSETDAWFTNTLDQTRIRVQMERRARIQKFYADYDERSKCLGDQQHGSQKGRRSRSLDCLSGRARTTHIEEPLPKIPLDASDADGQSSFSYQTVFHRLIEVFSRHGNPFVKLNALRDLRSLVIASLVLSHESSCSTNRMSSSSSESERMRNGRSGASRRPTTRHSFSETTRATLRQADSFATSSSPPESVTSGCRQSDYSAPSEDQIVSTLRDLILEVKPKTLFRDLQFISAFVPSDQLNKTDRGTAFLQFGLAALSLKDEICNSMVEIADQIVSQELDRRHPLPGSEFYPRPGHAIEDAAGMWIITAKEGNPVAQRELAILYLTHPELLPRVTLPLTLPRDTFKAEMMYRRGKNSKSDPQSMCLALHWMQLSAIGGDTLACNRLREREEFDSIA